MGSRKWDIFDEQLTSIPGASSLHPAVMRAMQRPYVNPWAEEFILYLNETLDLLKIIYNTKQDVLIMMGPIRLAMDAVVCSLLELGCKTAGILVNGYWSQLFSEIMENHGIFPIVIDEEWGLPLDPEKVKGRLDILIKNHNIKVIFATHVETSTGIINPIKEIGEIARERGLLFVVDAAQTLGGIEIRVDDWGIDFCISGSHKCMSAPAGLSFIAISKRGWEAIENRDSAIQGWYTNLVFWREAIINRTRPCFTLSSSLVFGLRAALDQMFAISLPEIYRRYKIVAKAVRSGIKEMGLQFVSFRDDCYADTATAVLYPPDVIESDFYEILYNKYSYASCGTYGPFAGKAFRVGPTGLLQIRREVTLHMLTCLGLALKQLGHDINLERSLCVADSELGNL